MKKQKASFLRKLLPFLLERKGQLAGVFALVLIFVFVSRSLPILFGHTVDEGLRKKDIDLTLKLALAYLGLELVRCLFAFLQHLRSKIFAESVMAQIRAKLIKHLMSLPTNYFDKTPTGRIVTRATNDVRGLGDLLSSGLSDCVVAAIEMVSVLIAMIYLSPELTLGVIVFTPLIFGISFFISRKIRVLFSEAKNQLAGINAHAAESFTGIRILNLFQQEKRSQFALNQLSGRYMGLQLETIGLFAKLWPTVEFFNTGTIAVLLLVGSFYSSRLGLSIGDFAALILLVQSFYRPVRLILERYTHLQDSAASADRIFQILELKPEEDLSKETPASLDEPLSESEKQSEELDSNSRSMPPEGVGPKTWPRSDQTKAQSSGQDLLPNQSLRKPPPFIEFRNVWFRYETSPDWVLKNISFEIERGQKIALAGRTGSGKSSTVSLLQKLYDPQKGSILFQGRDLSSYSLSELRRKVGIVQQDNFIFKGSVADNIGLLDPGISREQIESAIEHVGLTESLGGSLEKAFQFQIGEQGANISLGQRQLIAFARVLAFDPEVFILDEATAHVDSLHEQKIQLALQKTQQNRTSLAIAHRLSTITHSDKIFVFESGQIIESGNHQELLGIAGTYSRSFHPEDLHPPH